MLALKIVGIIALIILLICLIPIGADISFIDDRLKISAKAAGKLIQIFPRKKKKDEKPGEEKAEESKEKKNKKEKKGSGGSKGLSLHISKEEIGHLLKRIGYKFGRFNRSFRADRFLLHYIAGGRDPYRVAMKFAYVNAVLSAALPAADQSLKCKDLDVWTDVDFTRDWSQIDFACCIVIRIGAFPVLIFGIINSVLWMLIKNKIRLLWEKIFDKEQYLVDTTDNDVIYNIKELLSDIKQAIPKVRKENQDISRSMSEFDASQENTNDEYNRKE